MTPVFQTRFGTDGNCWPACLASYFEVPLEEVDHCSAANPEWQKNTEEWLAGRGLFYFEIDIKKAGFTAFPTGAILLGGVVSKSGLNHAVVIEARNPKVGTIEFWVIHDPLHPELKEKYVIEHVILFAHLKI